MGVSAVSVSQGDQFIRSLAARLGELRSMLEAVFDEPESNSPRERLAATLRSFQAQAATIGFTSLVEDLGACDSILQSASVLGHLDVNDGDLLSETLDRIADTVRTRLACEITPSSGSIKTLIPATGKPAESEAVDIDPSYVLLVAPASVVDGLVLYSDDPDESGPPLAIEQVSDVVSAREVVRALGPDLIVLDTELEGAQGLVEALVNDEFTDAIPIVALGNWESPEDAAPYIALGVARHLNKPVSPRALRRALTELSPCDGGGFEPIGSSSLDAISARLADELHRGLCDAATASSRDRAIDVGDGTEVLATLWSAVGRIRELLAVKADGQIHFASGGPEDAVLTGPWTGGGLSNRLAKPTARHAAEDESLEGITVLVAEGDLSMNWFLCGVLRDAGATVIDAFDGHLALSAAYQNMPDIVFCDGLLPKIDGVTLCRTLKKDVALGSVPFVLMSSSDELLQRAYELGVGAEAYLPKESSGERIVRRLLDLSVPLRRVASRLAKGGRVRGRLSGLSAYSVLDLVCKHRKSARFSLRDSSRNFEIEIRGGRPVCAALAEASGGTLSGAEVFDALVAVGMGRFDVQDVSDDDHVQVELSGSLQDLVTASLARIRAAQSLLAGSSLVGVQAVEFNDLERRVCFDAIPAVDRELLGQIQKGASPRELIVTGQAPASQIEAVLCDVARRGAIRGVILCDGTDALPQAMDCQRALLRGEADYGAALDAHRGSVAALLASAPRHVSRNGSESRDLTEIGPVVTRIGSPCSIQDKEGNTAIPPGVAVQAAPVVDVGDHVDTDPLHPDESERSECVITRTTTPAGEELRYEGPLGRSNEPVIIDQRHCTPILASAGKVITTRSRDETPMLASAVVSHTETQGARLASSAPALDDALHLEDPPLSESSAEEANFPKLPRLPRPSVYARRSVPPQEKKTPGVSRFLWPLVFGVVGVGMAIGARWVRDSAPAPALPPAPAPTLTAPSEQAVPTKPEGAQAPKAETARTQIFELSPKERAKVRSGHGLLEIVAGRKHKVAVDGKEIGTGPVSQVALEAREKTYEIRVTLPGEQRVRYVTVVADKRTRVTVAPPWSR